MPSPILARADALMQRRRQNMADDAGDLPVLTDAIASHDDFPVLTEVAEMIEKDDDFPLLLEVETPSPLAAEPIEPVEIEAPSLTVLSSEVRSALVNELAYRIEQRLLAELPRLIASTLEDFLSEQETTSALQNRD